MYLGIYIGFFFFFKLLFGCPTANFGPLSRGQPHSPDVNHCVLPEGHRKPRNEVGSQSPAERLVGIEPGTFRFLLQRLNPLGHKKQNKNHLVVYHFVFHFDSPNIQKKEYEKKTFFLPLFWYFISIFFIFFFS